MTDIVDKKTRSRMMAGIRGKDTGPETLIRKALFKRGYRYRLHDPRLPGKPDMVFPKYRAIILVNGCFWHGHVCHLFKWPKNREKFWRLKIEGNVRRDMKNQEEYQAMGWRVLILWECAIKGKKRHPQDELVDRIAAWLVGASENMEIMGK